MKVDGRLSALHHSLNVSRDPSSGSLKLLSDE